MATAKSAPDAERRRLGVLGGTFNPPHRAHLALARAALRELGLERVLVVPARRAPHKTDEPGPGPERRLRMCELAFAAEPGVEVCRAELDRPGLSYTVDTLRYIRATNSQYDLVLIVGADTASTLQSWREPQEVLRMAALAVAGRDALARRAVESAVRSVDEHARPEFLKMGAVELSSSQVRARAAAGQPIEDMVGEPVARYISEHELYSEQELYRG